jgi:hypothetical protein
MSLHLPLITGLLGTSSLASVDRSRKPENYFFDNFERIQNYSVDHAEIKLFLATLGPIIIQRLCNGARTGMESNQYYLNSVLVERQHKVARETTVKHPSVKGPHVKVVQDDCNDHRRCSVEAFKTLGGEYVSVAKIWLELRPNLKALVPLK